jgi:Protein of unknown function (DUF4235)
MSKTSKALYLPLSIATSVTGGLLAGAVFGQIWKRFSDQEPAPPDPKDLNNSSRGSARRRAARADLRCGEGGRRSGRRPRLRSRHT